MPTFDQWGPIAIIALIAFSSAIVWDLHKLQKAHDRVVATLHSIKIYHDAMMKNHEDSLGQ